MSILFAEPLITRFGPRAVLRASLAIVFVALAWFARLPADATYVIDVLPALTLIGIGSGLGFPSLVSLAMSGATRDDAGLASGLVNTTRQVGGALGLAAMASLATTRGGVLASAGASPAAALAGGAQLAFTFAAVLVLAAFGVAATVLRSDGGEAAIAATADDEDFADAMPDAA
jgi:MFS family permease